MESITSDLTWGVPTRCYMPAFFQRGILMRHSYVTFAAAVSLSLFAFGCSGADAASEDDASEDVTGDTEDALTARDHFAANDVELAWRPGCGMRRPDGTACYMGLELAFTRTYRDLRTTIRTSVNNSTDVITVKLDTWSPSGARHAIAF